MTQALQMVDRGGDHRSLHYSTENQTRILNFSSQRAILFATMTWPGGVGAVRSPRFNEKGAQGPLERVASLGHANRQRSIIVNLAARRQLFQTRAASDPLYREGLAVTQADSSTKARAYRGTRVSKQETIQAEQQPCNEGTTPSRHACEQSC